MSIWTSGLNPEQREAVLHVSGPLLILAGAGSGKTSVLVARTGHLLTPVEQGGAGVRAEQICVLTFTNKAARELKHRVTSKLGNIGRDIWAGTFHSFGLYFLRQNARRAGLPDHFGIIDQSDAEGIVRELLVNIRAPNRKNRSRNGASSDVDAGYKLDRLLSQINELRARRLRIQTNPTSLPSVSAAEQAAQDADPDSADDYEVMAEILMPKYVQKLEHMGVVDFDELLLKPLQLLHDDEELRKKWQNKFRYLMVDEFQDTNPTQMELVCQLIGPEQNLAVVGDDDQSIYGWRGACVRNILDFPRRFERCRVVRLERNYRSTPAILSLANHIIAQNKDRHGKVLQPSQSQSLGLVPELFVCEDEEDEVKAAVYYIREFLQSGFPPSEIAVLYRSNGQGSLLEGELRRENIPYSVSGGIGLFDRKEIKDVLAYLRCAIAPHDVAFRRILNTPPRGIGDATIQKIDAATRLNSSADFSEASSDDESTRRTTAAPSGHLFVDKRRRAALVRQAERQSFMRAARAWQLLGVPLQTGASIEELFETLRRLPEILLADQGSPRELLLTFLESLGYRDYLRQQVKNDEAFHKRWVAIGILGQVLEKFLERGGKTRETLKKFIDAMELRDDVTEDPEAARSQTQLLTLHACKGLEFKGVVLMGLEEDLLPHRTLGSDIDEERRLFYVGVTRAKERLIMLRAKARSRFQKKAPVTPSRFLQGIPAELMRSYDGGYRPLAPVEKQNMLDELYKKLNMQIADVRARSIR